MLTHEHARAKQLRFIRYYDRMWQACQRIPTPVLRTHYARLQKRRNDLVIRGIADGTWTERESLRGIIFDIGTQMLGVISNVVDDRRIKAGLAAAALSMRGAAP